MKVVVISEIINGCHRAKAILKHGIYELEVDYLNYGNDDLAEGSEGIKLIEVPELGKREYEKYYASFE